VKGHSHKEEILSSEDGPDGERSCARKERVNWASAGKRVFENRANVRERKRKVFHPARKGGRIEPVGRRGGNKEKRRASAPAEKGKKRRERYVIMPAGEGEGKSRSLINLQKKGEAV